MESWTTRRLLAWTTQHFEDKAVDSPRVAAEMLLGHVLNVPRLKLYMEPDRPASAEERDRFRALVARAGKHEPVDYLIGKAPFFSLEFRVGPAVLIPRPSTETIVEHVLQRERSTRPRPRKGAADVTPVQTDTATGDDPSPTDDESELEPEPLRLADVCTGSGVIALALAQHLPHATFVATDLSDAALDVARQNAEDHGVAERIDFRTGDLLAPLGAERFDYVLSNPPYISDAEWAQVLPNVRDHEPATALRSGTDGLDHLRPLVAGVADHLTPGGQALLEFSSTQADAVQRLAAEAGFAESPILKDHERFPRVIVLSMPRPQA
jgi:release factor glutamine methyltransferase